jgi:hypothetical protein
VIFRLPQIFLVKSPNPWNQVMWTEKLLSGVLRVLTPLGPRYLKPSIGQRLYLLWVFRNFQTLPFKVLSARQQRLIEGMCDENRFVAWGVGFDDAPLLGTLEQRPPASAHTVQPRRPSTSVGESVAPFAAEGRRR